MNPVSRILNLLVSPLVPIIGALFSSEVEKLVALAEIDQHEELEERARQLEAEGKTQLAARLRQRASKISSDCPGQYGNRIMGELQHDCKQLAGPEPDAVETPTEATEPTSGTNHSKNGSGPKRRGRRKADRTLQTDKS